MLVVFGSAFDEQPRLLVERWRTVGRDAILSMPADLSRAGWRLRCGRREEPRAAFADRVVPGNDIDGVIVALDWIAPHELTHVVEDDRDYVAQEMTAFLLAWLHELRCPVIDQPTPTSLAGCGRTPVEWARMAARVGVAANPGWKGATRSITVVGGHAVGDVPSQFALAAEAISRCARRGLVTLRFMRDEPQLVGSSLRPEVGDAAVADALLGMLS